jgi:hypothetical protein
MSKQIFMVTALSFTMMSFAAPTNTIKPLPNLSGTYTCNGYDNSEGNSQGTLILALDANGSMPAQGYVAYQYKESTMDGERYTGSVLANGNMLSEYFENVEPDEYTDSGMASVLVTYDKDGNGNNLIIRLSCMNFITSLNTPKVAIPVPKPV